MFYWIYDLPTWLAMTLFGAAFVGIFWLGAILLSPIVKSWLHRQSDFNATLGNYLGYFGVIYGLLLGLLAIGTYENFTNAEKAGGKRGRGAAGALPQYGLLSRAVPERFLNADPRLRPHDDR